MDRANLICTDRPMLHIMDTKPHSAGQPGGPFSLLLEVIQCHRLVRIACEGHGFGCACFLKVCILYSHLHIYARVSGVQMCWIVKGLMRGTNGWVTN